MKNIYFAFDGHNWLHAFDTVDERDEWIVDIEAKNECDENCSAISTAHAVTDEEARQSMHRYFSMSNKFGTDAALEDMYPTWRAERDANEATEAFVKKLMA